MDVDRGGVRFDIGPRVGFAYGRNMPVIPFVWGSPQVLISSNNSNGEAGFGTEITGGIMIPIKEHFSINFGPTFWFQTFDRFWSNTITVGASVTGLIF